MSELPSGWIWTAVGEVADVRLGKMLDAIKNKGTPVPYLRNINVRWGSFDLADILEMRMTAEEQESYSIEDGDVIVCEGGEPGRAAVWRSGPTKLKFQKALHRARTFDAVSPEWLAFYMRHIATNGELQSRFTGTTIKHLPLAAMREVPMPLPPIHEQRRLVSKIDSLSAKSRRARGHLDHIHRLVEKYKESVLDKVFVSAKGTTLELSKVVLPEAPIRYGVIQPGTIKDVGVPLIRVCDLQDGGVAWSDLRRISPEIDANYADARVQAGDILVSVVGTIGRVALVTEPREPTNIARAVARVRPNPRTVLPEWLAWRLQSRDCQNFFQLEAREVARKTLNIAQLKITQIDIPPLTEQAAAVEVATRAFAWIDRLASEATSARKLIGHLDQAVLGKAFRGELVPQDPNDEPACVLLERIRGERATVAPARGNKKIGTKRLR
ncbi:restriction endonuclease subunit S [Bradyrhizobium sp. B025]|jgi:type I restriction enzyme, S subunit|uniref:restriction endonuclease subunit S n=1 Tax=Bradyrhizobium sp. B025 TaxID=3344829 RepID=UPI0035D48E01